GGRVVAELAGAGRLIETDELARAPVPVGAYPLHTLETARALDRPERQRVDAIGARGERTVAANAVACHRSLSPPGNNESRKPLPEFGWVDRLEHRLQVRFANAQGSFASQAARGQSTGADPRSHGLHMHAEVIGRLFGRI